MTSQPGDEESKAAHEFERGRSEMERGWRTQQQNVLPLAAAWNEGRFYGRALKSDQPKTTVRRIGLFFIGIQLIGGSLMFMFAGLPVHLPGRIFHYPFAGVSIISLPIHLILILVGVRLCWMALERNQPAKK